MTGLKRHIVFTIFKYLFTIDKATEEEWEIKPEYTKIESSGTGRGRVITTGKHIDRNKDVIGEIMIKKDKKTNVNRKPVTSNV